jgi:hypothetical protein
MEKNNENFNPFNQPEEDSSKMTPEEEQEAKEKAGVVSPLEHARRMINSGDEKLKEEGEAQKRKIEKLMEQEKESKEIMDDEDLIRWMLESRVEFDYKYALGKIKEIKEQNIDRKIVEKNISRIEEVKHRIDEKIKEISILEQKKNEISDEIKSLKYPQNKINKEAINRYPKIGEFLKRKDRLKEIEAGLRAGQYKKESEESREHREILKEFEKDPNLKSKTEESIRFMLANEVQDFEERLAIAHAFELIDGQSDLEIQQNIDQLQLQDFISEDLYKSRMHGWRVERHPDYKKIKNAQNKTVEQWHLLPDDSEQEKQKLEDEWHNTEESIDNLKSEKWKIEKEKVFLRKFYEHNLDLDKMQEKIPWAVQMIREGNYHGMSVDIEEEVVAFLESRSWDSGSAGMEYGNNIIVARNNETNRTQKYIKWRDAYSQSKDRPDLDFNRVKINSVTDESVGVSLFNDSRDYRSEESFALQKKEIKEELLSSEEERQWKEDYEKIKRETKENCGVKGKMPAYVDLMFLEGNLPAGVDSSREVPYQEPFVLDQKIDSKRGLGVFVVKSQIDHYAGYGKQFRWEAFLINKNKEVKRIAEETAYELALKEGKKIDIRAEDLLLFYQKQGQN